MRQTHASNLEEAADSDLLFELTVRGAMQHFGLTADQVKEAKLQAQTEWPKSRYVALMASINARRWRKRVLTHEVYWPGIHRSLIIDEESCARTAEKYGISSSMAFIALSELRKLADLTGASMKGLVLVIEEEAQDPVAAAAVNHHRKAPVARKTASRRLRR